MITDPQKKHHTQIHSAPDSEHFQTPKRRKSLHNSTTFHHTLVPIILPWVKQSHPGCSRITVARARHPCGKLTCLQSRKIPHLFLNLFPFLQDVELGGTSPYFRAPPHHLTPVVWCPVVPPVQVLSFLASLDHRLLLEAFLRLLAGFLGRQLRGLEASARQRLVW